MGSILNTPLHRTSARLISSTFGSKSRYEDSLYGIFGISNKSPLLLLVFLHTMPPLIGGRLEVLLIARFFAFIYINGNCKKAGK